MIFKNLGLILDNQFENSNKKYNQYLTEHISNVKKAYDSIREGLKDEEYIDIYKLDQQMTRHDESKYDDIEYVPYRNNFYPVTDTMAEENKPAYDKAWNHHQKTNPHHWQYWILIRDEGIEEILDMDTEYIIEMLCDWSSFQYKNPGSTANKWYSNNKSKMKLSKHTQERIEYYLKKFPTL